jgi:non-ribosomal peptide synthetase-like protein
LTRVNPLVLFVGSPLYVLYLRALGAKIGGGVVILSRMVPVCTDLLTIGAGTVIRKDTYFTCYRAQAGVIQTGAVTIGRNVLVGEMTVLDIETSLGEWAQLGHSSSLHAGQAVPAGQHWHGSPAQRTDTDYRTVPRVGCSAWRRASYAAMQLLVAPVLYMPLGIGIVAVLLTQVPQLAVLLGPGPSALTSWTFYGQALVASLLLFFGPLLVGLLVVGTVPRVLSRAIRPGTVYRLYGIHFGIHRTIALITNVRFYKTIFGDSSWIVGYLRYLGYHLRPVRQTGSNFGTQLKHEVPHFSFVGTGTMVADGLSIMNADYSSTAFRVSWVSIGARNFLGNHVAYPAGARTGENCLLATKVMVPFDGPVREGVGLLGSPSFEIPRSVERDVGIDRTVSPADRRGQLAAKNRHNAGTIGMYLLARWLHVLGITLIVEASAGLYHALGASAVALANVLVVVFTVAWFVLVERASAGFRALRPLSCSIYTPDFWRHERFWKGAAVTAHLQMLNGTPFKNVAWRLLGVRLGRRLFDDGTSLPEKTLVTIGDDVTLNAGSVIQCHSQEDGAFKSDRITIGSGCTVGVGAWVHYGVTMGEGATLAANSFLMKGEDVAHHAHWGGNPARELREASPVLGAVPASTSVPKVVPITLAAVLTFLASTDVAVIAHVIQPSTVVPALRNTQLPVEPIPTASPAGASIRGTPTPAAFSYADVRELESGLRVGSEGPTVATLQRQLGALGLYPGAAHGDFDEPTAAAVRTFQAQARVTNDPRGTVGRATAVALVAAGPRPTLGVGATGEDVYRLQQALIVALARPLSASGNFRSATRDAVSDYQASRGLLVDGTAGDQTWTALQEGR